MQLSSEFQSKLENPNGIFTTDELEIGIRLLMIDFIEERVGLYQLLEINERLRKSFVHSLSKKFFEVVYTFHTLHEERHDSTKRQRSNEEITYMVDDLLCQLT